jgi:hypothetical protein
VPTSFFGLQLLDLINAVAAMRLQEPFNGVFRQVRIGGAEKDRDLRRVV